MVDPAAASVDQELITGFGGIGVAEQHGGHGGGLPELDTVVRSLGRNLWPGHACSHLLAVQAAAAAGLDVSAAVSGSERWTLAVVSEQGEVRAMVATPATVVIGVRGDQIGRAEVYATEAIEGSDPGRPAASLRVGEWRWTPSGPVAWQRVALLLASEQQGAAEGALDLAVSHARTREQFGRPIGSFQAVAHPLADSYIELREAAALLARAAHSLEARSGATTSSLTAARLVVAEAARATAEASLQVHGAMGMTAESDVHLYLHRIWGLDAVLPGARSLALQLGEMSLTPS